MSWIEVRALVREGLVDTSPVIDTFVRNGVENTLEDGLEIVGCVVDVEGSGSVIADLVRELQSLDQVASVQSHPLAEVNWEEAWKQFFKPRRVGRRFVVRPTWEEYPAEPGDCVIVLDPGQAFGTGDHPTTRLCLELLEDAFAPGARVADLGCGSGILAVGASLLGADSVDAIDIDPLCVEVAKENMKLNGVTFRALVGDGATALLGLPPSVSFEEAPQDETPLESFFRTEETAKAETDEAGPYDLVLSNIISATLIRICPDVARLVRPGGEWIVSGIIDANWPDVLAAAQSYGFRLVTQKGEDGWVAARFTRPRSG